MKYPRKKINCKPGIERKNGFREDIPEIVERLVDSYNQSDGFNHVDADPIPLRETVVEILHRIRKVLYPGYFISSRLDEVNVGYYLGQELILLFEMLSDQLARAIRHDCIRHNLSCTHCVEQGQQIAIEFLDDTAGAADHAGEGHSGGL